MSIRKILYIALIVILIGSGTIGCQDSKKEDEEESAAESVPYSLEQIQQLSDEIVTSSMKKDWTISLEKTKELMAKWNSLYPDIQKQGVKQEDVDAFVASLNTLTDNLISIAMKQPLTAAEEEKSEEQSSEEEKETEKASEEGDSADKESEESEQKQPEEESEEKKGEETEEKEKEGEEKEQEESEEGQDSEEDKDPKVVLSELDPLIDASKEELDVINSAVEVTKTIPNFMSLFKSPVPPDFFKLKYLVRHLHVAAKLENWDVVSTDFKSVTQTWESVQYKAVEASLDDKIKLDQSIKELGDVINSKNANLTGVKSNFIVEQIETIAKIIKDKEEQKEEEQK